MNNIFLSTINGILTITVNRPDKLNALNRETIQEIGVAVRDAEKDQSIKGIILTGAGEKAFIAGADISEFSSYSVPEGMDLSRAGHKVFDSIENCSKPVIAAVNGFALGGGCELAMSCHLRIASDNAKFGQPEVKLGLIPGYAGTQRLVQLIGKSKALEMLMTGDMISANEAFARGLVSYVVPQSELIEKCMELLNKITAQSPQAISAIIRSVNAFYTDGVNGFEVEIDEFGKCFGTEDFIEGVTAFSEKRKPVFSGSVKK